MVSFCTSQGPLFLPVGRRRQSHCLSGKRTPTPSSLLQQAFEILSGGRHEGFTVDPPESSQAKALHPMPLFALCKQRFHPDLAFVHGLLVRRGLMVPLDPFEVVGIKRTVELPTAFA